MTASAIRSRWSPTAAWTSALSYENEEDRWWKTDLREKKIEMGAAFKVTEKETEYDYKIVKLDTLGE